MPSVPEQLINQVFAVLTTADSTIRTATGRRELEANAGPHRVVAVPTGAPIIDLPDRPGDSRYTDAGRIILLRRFVVEWTCHDMPNSEGAVDFTNSEALYLATLVAIRGLLHHSVVFSNERWLDQEAYQDSYERNGTAIEFTSTIDLPVYESRGGVVTLTATPKIDTTVTIQGDVVAGDKTEIQEG